MNDEIKDDNLGQEDDFEKLKKSFSDMKGGKPGKVPNLTHLPEEQKAEIGKEALTYCCEMMMSVCLSLGLYGGAAIGLGDGVSGRRFDFTFSAPENDE